MTTSTPNIAHESMPPSVDLDGVQRQPCGVRHHAQLAIRIIGESEDHRESVLRLCGNHGQQLENPPFQYRPGFEDSTQELREAFALVDGVVEFRERQRADRSTDQPVFLFANDMIRVKGIGSKTVRRIRPFLRFPDSPLTIDRPES